MNKDFRAMLATVAWTSVLALAIARTVAGIDDMTIWALLVGHVAAVLTAWLAFEHVVQKAAAESLQELRAMDDRTVERVSHRLASVLREDNVSPLR